MTDVDQEATLERQGYAIEQHGDVRIYSRPDGVLLAFDGQWVPGFYGNRETALIMGGILMADYTKGMILADNMRAWRCVGPDGRITMTDLTTPRGKKVFE